MTQQSPTSSQPAPIAAPVVADPDVNDHLRVDDVTTDLKSRSAKSGAMMITSQAIQLGITIAGTAILARLLTPQDFGYMMMVTTLTSFIGSIRDMGLPFAAVHKKHLTDEQASGLFWVNAMMSIFTALLLAAAAPVLAWFYGESRLVGITLVITIGILISSVTMVHVGLMRRQLKFSEITILQIGSILAGVMVGIVAAYFHAGYWALVFQQLATYLWQAGSAWLLCGWRPVRRSIAQMRADPELRSMVRFGRDASGARLLGKIGRNIDAVLVGYFAGATALGLYQKAYQWSIIPFNQLYTPLQGVAVASFSRLQDDHNRYRLYARTILLGLFGITLPAMAFLCIEAQGVILLLLGQQWTASIPIFQVLTVAAYFHSFTLVTKWLFLSEGRTGEQLRWAMISTPTMILAVAVGVRWGALGVACGFAAGTIVLVVPGVWYCLRRSPIGIKDYLSAAWRPVTASLVAAGLLVVIKSILPQVPLLFIQVSLSGLLFGVLYAACWLVLPGARAEIMQLVRHFRQK